MKHLLGEVALLLTLLERMAGHMIAGDEICAASLPGSLLAMPPRYVLFMRSFCSTCLVLLPARSHFLL